MERTISGSMGKGSVNHNKRAFKAKNVDPERSIYNVQIYNENIKTVYHKLFDDALERYNAKQKRSDRKIDNYYKKISQSRQEKTFHEVIFQIGNKEDMNARSENGQLAKKILLEFMQDFQGRNPNLYVFSAHLHMDEETPHLHIDFVPVFRGSKRGLDTRVSLKGALGEQGFKGGTGSETEWNQWITSEKQELSKVMERYGVQWKQLGTHNKHLSVLDFEKQERQKEVAELDRRIEKSGEALREAEQLVDSRLDRAEELAEISGQLQEQNTKLQAENEDLEGQRKKLESDNKELEKQQQKLQNKLEAMAGSKNRLERNVRAYDEDKQWQLPEPSAFTSAKSYWDANAKPLVDKLKELVKSLTIKCVNLTDQVRKLTDKVNRQASDIEWYKEKLKEKTEVVEMLQEKAVDLERVKLYMGADKVRGMIDSMKEVERLNEERKRLQRNYNKSMGR